LARNVAVDPFHRIAGSKWQVAREHLVKGGAQRVEIAARINRAIHTAGLFGCHIGQSAGNDLRRRRRLAFAEQLRRNPEPSEPYLPSIVDEHIRRLDVFMDKAVPMDLAECFRQANSDAQEERQFERLPLVLLKNPIQRITARVLKYEDRPPVVTSERQRLGCPCGIEVCCERVFMLQPPKSLRGRLFRGEWNRKDRRWVAILSPAVKGEVPAFPEELQHVP
jgi:hypothetical protein